jgi:hypothetical protein
MKISDSTTKPRLERVTLEYEVKALTTQPRLVKKTLKGKMNTERKINTTTKWKGN